MRLEELKQNLLDRKYKRKVIEDAFKRVNSVTREEALKKVLKNKTTKRPVFAVTYDPRMPDINKIVTTAYKNACKDHKFKKTFPEKPLIAYRRQKNIGEFITRAQLYPLQRNGATNTREQAPGFKKCKKTCAICPYVENSAYHSSSATGEKFKIKSAITCSTKNVIYDL